jgi:hypothetical protein
MPGWPELAFCTASIAKARIALAIKVVVCVGFMGKVGKADEESGGAGSAKKSGQPVNHSQLFYQTGAAAN